MMSDHNENTEDSKRMNDSLRSSLKEQLEDRLAEKDLEKKTGGKTKKKAKPAIGGSIWREPLGALFGKTSTRDITTFCEELSLLLDAGLPIVPAMYTLAERATNPLLGKIIADMADRIESGASFSEAASVYSGEFGELFINMFRAGERSGTLVDAVKRVADRGEQIMETRHRVISVLMYPAIITVVAIGVICFAFSYTMSAFQPLLTELGADIPWTMGALMDVGAKLQNAGFWTGVLSVVVVLAIIYFIGQRFSAFRLVRDRLLIRTPLLGRIVKQNLVANFSRVFSIMIAAGVPLAESLQAARNTTPNEVVRLAIDRTQATVREGGQIVPPLEREGIFPPLAYDMMEVAEETGEMDHVFRRIADIYEHKSANDMEILGKLVQPAIIVLMAIIVGFIVVAMFHTYSTLLVQATGA